jgi:hypothetical protein
MKLNFRQLCLIVIVFLSCSGTALAANYIVSGATNNPDANGLYVQDGTSDGVPQYIKGIWTLAREQPMGPAWVIRNGSDPFNDMIYVNWPGGSPGPSVPPSDGNWIEWQGDPAPGLTITLAPSESIPSMNTWGVIIMITLLSGIAIFVIRKTHFPNPGSHA